MAKKKIIGRKSNCTASTLDAVFFVDYEHLSLYREINNKDNIMLGCNIQPDERNAYEYDQDLSQKAYDDFKEKLIAGYQRYYKSMQVIDEYNNKLKKQHYILTNKQFRICIEDNEWAIAVHLLHNDDYTKPSYQEALFQTYKNHLRDVLLDLIEPIYIRTGSYATEPITKEIAAKMDKAESKRKKDYEKRCKEEEQLEQKRQEALLQNENDGISTSDIVYEDSDSNGNDVD